ncbi:MAG: hypothetical protein Q4D98_09135 [Planctomycetia bacterium]|nr:hypothetical protein [Planctomycetia bacterium]
MAKTHPGLLLVFYLLGLFPLLGLLVWGGVRHTAWYVHTVESQVEKRLKLPVTIEKVQHPGPGRTRLTEVRLFDESADDMAEEKPLFVVPRLEIREHNVERDGRKIRLQQWTIPEMTLEAIRLETLWNLHRQVLAEVGYWRDNELELDVEEQVRVQTAVPLEVRNARLRIFQGAFGPQTDIVFTLPDGEMDTPVQATLQSVRKKSATAILATLTTASGGIPAEHLFSLFPILEKMGDKTRFSGEIIIQQSFRGWSGLFRGTFQNLDLSQVLSPDTPLSGRGELRLESARFDGGRLVEATGTFTAGPGNMKRDFLEKIMKITRLAARGDLQNLSDPVPFERLAFGFRIQNGQITLTGQCPDFGPGVYLTSTNAPLLREPETPRKPFSAALFFTVMAGGEIP